MLPSKFNLVLSDIDPGVLKESLIIAIIVLEHGIGSLTTNHVTNSSQGGYVLEP